MQAGTQTQTLALEGIAPLWIDTLKTPAAALVDATAELWCDKPS